MTYKVFICSDTVAGPHIEMARALELEGIEGYLVVQPGGFTHWERKEQLEARGREIAGTELRLLEEYLVEHHELSDVDTEQLTFQVRRFQMASANGVRAQEHEQLALAIDGEQLSWLAAQLSEEYRARAEGGQLERKIPFILMVEPLV